MLVLNDADGHPVGAAAAPLTPGHDPVTLDLGTSRVLGEARSWALAVRSPTGAEWLVPSQGTPAIQARAFPIRFESDVVIQSPAGEKGENRLRSVRLTKDARGNLAATVELVGQELWKEHLATTVLVLLDHDKPIAVGTAEAKLHVEGGVHDEPALPVPLAGQATPATAQKLLVGFTTKVLGHPMGSRWLMYIADSPTFPIALLLGGDDPAVWRRGLGAIHRELNTAKLRGASLRSRDDSITRAGWEEIHRVLRPHNDRLIALFSQVAERLPRELPGLCWLAGYSGDARFIDRLRPLLADPREAVTDEAAVGLGLLGDRAAEPRLRAIAARPLPSDRAASDELRSRKTDVARALRVLEAKPAAQDDEDEAP